MKIKKVILPFICCTICGLIILSSKTNAKYYSTIVEQVWKTNFTYYGVVNPGDVKFRYTIDAQSADNPPSMFDGKPTLNHNEWNASTSDKNRWTNWSDSGTNKGEDARIVIGFIKPVYVTAIRLYYFVDNGGCDIPRDISLSYVSSETGKSIEVINDVSLNDLNNSFSVATNSGRTSIFRDINGGVNSGAPIYYDIKTGTDINYTEEVYGGWTIHDEAPNTTIYFKEDKSPACITSFDISMQAGEGWYIGLTEMAVDWIFADYDYSTNPSGLAANSSPWYDKLQ